MKNKLEVFIEKARRVHGGKYDYSNVVYIDNRTDVDIICHKKNRFGREHGVFPQTPDKHINRGQGCPRCSGRKKDIDEIIADFRDMHGDKYDYSKMEYVNNHTDITIICPKHGEFPQSPKDHKRGHGCPDCYKESLISQPSEEKKQEFIEKARKVHGDKYDYSEVVYINNHTDVEIYCKICNKYFPQKPMTHLAGCGCKFCKNKRISEKRTIHTTESFINDCKQNHKFDYDYSQTIYRGMGEHIDVICKKHGLFQPFAFNFHRGCECQKCMFEVNSQKRIKPIEQFIEDARKIHGDRYDYSKFEYKKGKIESTIICKKCGHEFPQTPGQHLRGCGCPRCNYSSVELEMENFLNLNNIKFIPQYQLGRQKGDFYLSDFRILIECHGQQHFIPKFYTREKKKVKHFIFQDTVQRDIRKYKACQEKGIKVMYFTKDAWVKDEIFTDPIFEGIYTKENVFTDKNRLLEDVMKQ